MCRSGRHTGQQHGPSVLFSGSLCMRLISSTVRPQGSRSLLGFAGTVELLRDVQHEMTKQIDGHGLA